MNKIAKFYDNERGQPWTIRVLDIGDKYGREDCLTYDADEPVVEFYDADHPHTIDAPSGTVLGQFVSRYYISTICDEVQKYFFPSAFCYLRQTYSVLYMRVYTTITK